MFLHPRGARRAVAGVVLGLLLLTVPAAPTVAQVPAPTPIAGCIIADQLQATSCRLMADGTVEGEVTLRHGGATWRLDVLAPDATLDLAVGDEHGRTEVSVLDWRGQALATSVRNEGMPEAHLRVVLPVPGVYGVRVGGTPPPEQVRFRLSSSLTYPVQPPSPAWPPDLVRGAPAIVGERQVIRVQRGGTPAAGVAASRILGTPPDGVFSDFTLVADVQFEKIVGPSALTVRFRYEPEAGGGTGYVLSVNPFAGTATLDTFEEGQRHTLVDDAPLGTMPTSEGANRLVLTANGPAIRVTLDGQTVVEASDSRFARGLIAVGAVTWSDPVAVTFDHIQVTTPTR
jgi:hypothetical protein